MAKPLHSVRLPPAAADAFVALDDAPGRTPVAVQPSSPLAAQPAGVSAVQPAGTLAVEPASPPGAQPASSPAVRLVSRRKTVERADGRVLRKQTIYLEAELARRLAVYCAANGMDISEAVARAVDKLMEG